MHHGEMHRFANTLNHLKVANNRGGKLEFIKQIAEQLRCRKKYKYKSLRHLAMRRVTNPPHGKPQLSINKAIVCPSQHSL